MSIHSADDLAAKVVRARGRLEAAVPDDRRRAFPIREFGDLFRAVIEYSEAMKDSPLVHRDVAAAVNGLREYLELFKTPGNILYEADRLECIFFSGHDPYFEGDEPPGL
jgi:hypothetical protein